LSRALTPEMFREFTRVFKALGFTFVTVDTEGFRSGSMNGAKIAAPLIQLIS
jgi:pyridinium-3,5-biscarboxylic acid mononucleotide sulfurtransferase